MRATSFWTDRVWVDPGFSSEPTLNIHPEGQNRGSDFTLLFPLRTPTETQLRIADEVLAGVQKWRDLIAARAEQERTAENELAAAREEIARLKAAAEVAA